MTWWGALILICFVDWYIERRVKALTAPPVASPNARCPEA
jgi:hypothetical protein